MGFDRYRALDMHIIIRNMLGKVYIYHDEVVVMKSVEVG